MTPEQRICEGLGLILSNEPHNYTQWEETTVNKDSHGFIKAMELALFEYHQGLNGDWIRKIKTVKLLAAGKIYLGKCGGGEHYYTFHYDYYYDLL
jgi:hypothetical protein